MSRLKRLKLAACCSLIAVAQIAAPLRASEAEDRFLITELMDRYGTIHDFGTPEEYADLFTADGEMAIGGTPIVIKGREALMAQARRDHEKYVLPPGPDGKSMSFMRHIISNRLVELTGPDTANGSCYVMTYVQDGDEGPKLLSIGRYIDRYEKQAGQWRIAHREIKLEFGDQELAKKLGFR